MELSLFYFTFILFTLLTIADPTELDLQCPTSRRLLFFGGFNLPIAEKKSHHSSSISKSSSPPKYARSSDSDGPIVYIRPQTSHELGHKVRSYTHLLKSKLYTAKEKAILKQLQAEKKKQIKKKNSTEQKSSITTKTQELVAINHDELNRCKALLHIDVTADDNQKIKKSKKEKPSLFKVKNLTAEAAKSIKKKVIAASTSLPINDKKAKITKRNTRTILDEKKTNKILSPSVNKTNENRPFTSPVHNIPTKTSPPSSPTTKNTKSKQAKPQSITLLPQTPKPSDATEDDSDTKNNSVVGRAYIFVKNMFQLSDDSVDEKQTQEDRIITITNEQHHHHSRKLLSINEDDQTPIVTHDLEFNLHLNNEQFIRTTDELSSIAFTSIPKRQLLSVKTTKHSTSGKTNPVKEKKVKSPPYADANKPKVGWAYRYRISRYLNAQKMKRTGNKKKQLGGGKSKQLINSKQNPKKPTSSSHTKISKRKLLEYDSDAHSSWEKDEISDQKILNTVSKIKKFLPKRQLLFSKIKEQSEEDDLDQTKTRRRRKSLEELTDPIVIVQSYDHGLYKPRVGWQFRYRVSRYIDSLRDNIREDQERLKLGLQAIQRKTPQELSGRRKRVLDKPFTSDVDQQETIVNEQDKKPNVGWRYRYRVSKMDEAKKRGEYIDDEEEKRQDRLEQKNKPTSPSKTGIDHDERMEGENDLDPELRKINDEGRRVGWTYRYRIRRKLDHLKQQQAETGVPFDLATLGGKREKKVTEPKMKITENKTTGTTEQKPQDKTKSVGWEYRYRVSKMHDAQKREKSKVSTSKKHEQVPAHESLNPELTRLTPEQRVVGWQYRYRIRRKLDALKYTATRDNENGKRPKKRKNKEKMIKTVEDSIEQILNINDIDETPFMEYFRRVSSYILFGLLPTGKKSLCLLPLPITFSFCEKNITTIEQSKEMPIKKLKTKKEQRAKQFIRSHITKLGAEDKATERRVDETMKNLYQTPSYPPLQTPSSPRNSQKKQRIHPPNQSKKHEREEPIKKMVGVESKKNKNKKQFQIIGTEVKIKHKHLSPPPLVEVPKTTALPPLRSIPEVIQQEAATILATKRTSSRTLEEIQEELNETNESIQEYKKLPVTTTTPLTLTDSTTSGEDDNGSTSSTDNDNKPNGINVHDVPDLDDDKNSS